MNGFDAAQLVRIWHKADILIAPGHVRFWGQSGHWAEELQYPLLTDCDIADWSEISSVSLALIPLHPRGTRCDGVVVPLESQRLLAEHIGLEAPPSLDLKVVERTTVGTKPMGYARWEIYERAGLELLSRIPHLDHATALERDVTVGGAVGVGAGADVPMIG